MSSKLTTEIYNRFVDLMLIVGIDETTGLVLVNEDSPESVSDQTLDNLENAFYQLYKAPVLAAVSATKAVRFDPDLLEDPTYPPLYTTNLDGSGEHVLPSTLQETRTRSRSFNSRCDGNRCVTVSAEVLKRHLSGSDNVSVPEPQLPLSVEMIRSIPSFCFPDHAMVYRQKPEASVHFLVFTDDYARKTYATCITFYKPYKISKDSKTNLIEMSLDLKNFKPGQNEIQAFCPQCCVLISKYPYFYAMRECLSYMVEHIQQDIQEMFTFAKEYTYLLTMAPVPPAGVVAVSFSLFQLEIVLYPSESPEKPVIDVPLHLVFLAFSVHDVLTIFTAVLTEQRIVFLSSVYGLLTVIMESFWHFMQPFKWRYTYVPIICQTHLDLLEAPGTFMMGCHSKHKDIVEQISGLVVVDIDSGTVSINSSPANNSNTDRSQTSDKSERTQDLDESKQIPDIPREPAEIFKKVFTKNKFQLELSNVGRPSSYNPEEERNRKTKIRHKINTEISFAFLELMVNLFRGVLSELRIDHKLFNQDDFMKSVPESSKGFYLKVFQTDMFKTFVEERLSDKTDFWSDLEAKTRPYARKMSGVPETFPSLRAQSRKRQMKKQVSVSLMPSSLTATEFYMFRLPTLNSPDKYINTCIELLSEALKDCHDLEPRASYLYLRGMFLLVVDRHLDALTDLYSLGANNARLLNTDLVQQVLMLIPRSNHAIVRKRFRSFNLEMIKQFLSEEENEQRPRRESVLFKVKIPATDLYKEEFAKLVIALRIADDYDTILRLFEALGKTSENGHFFVDKETFESFCLCYKANNSQCESIKIKGGGLTEEECILCVSQLIKTDFGTGRIGLTDKRLFFLKDVSNTFKEIIKLRDIKAIEKQQSRSILNKVDVLVIKSEDGSVRFTSSLKDERDCWYMLIEEMKSGKIVAEVMRDLSVIHQAMLNVLLLKAVTRTREAVTVVKEELITSAVIKLGYFTEFVRLGRHKLPKDTTEALQRRVDPNFGEQEKKSVSTLLYVPGSCCNHNSDTGTPPRLWCCLGNGKIKSFDATNWELETSVISTIKYVECMVAVDDKQLWAGAHGIYIIDMETMTCNKTLTEHRDLVVDIQLSEDGRFAYSASVDSMIIKWEIKTLKCVTKIELKSLQCLRSLRLYDNKLWCGTWHAIIVCDMNGIKQQSFPCKFDRNKKQIPEITCFEITKTEVWSGCRREGFIFVWDRGDGQLKTTITLNCLGISVMLLSESQLWVGTKGHSEGSIYIYDVNTLQCLKYLKAHEDSVRSLCCAEHRYIISGAGSKDGKIAIWSPLTYSD